MYCLKQNVAIIYTGKTRKPAATLLNSIKHLFELCNCNQLRTWLNKALDQLATVFHHVMISTPHLGLNYLIE